MKKSETKTGRAVNLTYLLYRAIRRLVWFFYPKMEVVGAQNLPDGPAVIVGNHAQMNGPIAAQLYFPRKQYTWCAGEMMKLKEVPAYAYRDFWSEKPRCIRWLYKALSYVIAPLSVCVFNNAHTIPVYHDARTLSTFKETVRRLMEGADVVILPEHAKPYNHVLNDFQTRFADVAGLYFKRLERLSASYPCTSAPV